MPPTPRAAEYLDQVIAASRQAAGLARQMLTFSRRGEQQRRPVQLGPAVLEALRLLQASLPAGVEVEIDIPPAGRTVLADTAQIQQIVVNLWTNACHALKGTGGRIAVSLADVDVDAEMADKHPGLNAGPYVRLTVRDNGCGMTPEIQEQIFEPFFSTKPEGQGTGLGLPVVQTIMTGHQGAIVVESRPQAGTAMHLYFPEQPQDGGRARRGAAAAPREWRADPAGGRPPAGAGCDAESAGASGLSGDRLWQSPAGPGRFSRRTRRTSTWS